MSPEEFWTYVAEFPSHHRELPSGAEHQFVQALTEGTPSNTCF